MHGFPLGSTVSATNSPINSPVSAFYWSWSLGAIQRDSFTTIIVCDEYIDCLKWWTEPLHRPPQIF